MAVIETLTFRLAADADEAAFLEADRQVQVELIPNQEGFLRRTTARGPSQWLVVVLWASEADAASFQQLTASHPVWNTFTSFVDAASLQRMLFVTLD
ncbi:MAG: hypothetical protein QOG64_3198 [Acidimicrobiaceae bacterium]|nr:hypothetical protein [Acidimicrobiaceae bacterium]